MGKCDKFGQILCKVVVLVAVTQHCSKVINGRMKCSENIDTEERASARQLISARKEEREQYSTDLLRARDEVVRKGKVVRKENDTQTNTGRREKLQP